MLQAGDEDEVRIWADESMADEFTAVSSHHTVSLESNYSKLLQKHFSLFENQHYIYGVLTGFNYDDSNEEHCLKLFSHVCTYLPLELMDRINLVNEGCSDEDYENILREAFQETEKSIRQCLNDVLSEKTALEISLIGNNPSDYPKIKDKLNELSQKLSLGFSCVVTLINNDKIYVANVGDTRAILCTKSPDDTIRSEELSTRHDLFNPDELERLERLTINTETLKMKQNIGNMPLTRCLGNLLIKDFYKEYAELACAHKDPIISKPSFQYTEINESCLFLLLASSNLFQTLDDGIGKMDSTDDLLLMIKNQLSTTDDLKSVPDRVINDIFQIFYQRNPQSKYYSLLQETTQHSMPILLIRIFPNNIENMISADNHKTFVVVNHQRQDDDRTMVPTNDNDDDDDDDDDKRDDTKNDRNRPKAAEDFVDAYVDFTPLINALKKHNIDYNSI